MLTVFFRISIFPVRSPSSLSVAVTSFSGSNSSPTVSVLSSAWITGTSFNSSGFWLTSRFNVTFSTSWPWLEIPQSYVYITGWFIFSTVIIPVLESNVPFCTSMIFVKSILELTWFFKLNVFPDISTFTSVSDFLTSYKNWLFPIFKYNSSFPSHDRSLNALFLLTSKPLINVFSQTNVLNFVFSLTSNSSIWLS